MIHLNVDNLDACDVFLTKIDDRLWLAVCSDDNFDVGYVDARQLYEELKKYFDSEDQIKKGGVNK